MECQILRNDFPAHIALAIEVLVRTVGSLNQLTSRRYMPEHEIGAPDDTATNKRIAEKITGAWSRIKFSETLSAIQQEVLMELLALHGAIFEKGWLLTPKGAIRIAFDPGQIKKSTVA